MRKIELRKTRILKRILNSSAATSIAKAFRSINSETPDGSDSQGYSVSSTGPYLHYDEQKRVKLQMLKIDRKENDAFNITRHNALI